MRYNGYVLNMKRGFIMKDLFKRSLALILSFALVASLSACGESDNDDDDDDDDRKPLTSQTDDNKDNDDNNDNADDGDDNDDDAVAPLNLTIEQSIKDHMRLDYMAGECYYRDENDNTYSSYEAYAVHLLESRIPDGVLFDQVCWATGGDYFFLGSDGVVYSSVTDESYFPEKITYITACTRYVYGVTEDGRILFNDRDYPDAEDLGTVEGVSDARMIAACDGDGCIAVLHNDGTVTLDSMWNDMSEQKIAEYLEFDGLSQLHAMENVMLVDTTYTDNTGNVVIGLTSDGKLVGAGECNEDIFAWDDLVYAGVVSNFYFALTSGGDPLVSWCCEPDSYMVEEMEAVDRKLKLFSMPFAAVSPDGTVWGGLKRIEYAITPDRVTFEPALPGMEE